MYQFFHQNDLFEFEFVGLYDDQYVHVEYNIDYKLPFCNTSCRTFISAHNIINNKIEFSFVFPELEIPNEVKSYILKMYMLQTFV